MIRPGERLPREAELMTQFGASRTAVRDAVKVLASKGLVKTRQRGGTQVCDMLQWNAFDIDILAWRFQAGIDLPFVQDLIELRLATEPFAVRLAATRALPQDLDMMEEAHGRMQNSIGDWVAYANADSVLHMTIFSASHNRFLQSLGLIVHDVMTATFHAEEQSRGGTALRGVMYDDLALHTRLLACIRDRDPDRAEDAMRAIINFAHAQLTNLAQNPARSRLR
ncbi:MAG: FadR family transcriptional regulator [Rhizobiaceae bacterium]|nr:FadR family transcriptional regulator [Rhizobiaceae bacterium]